MSKTPDLDTYNLKTSQGAEISSPSLPYEPPMPRSRDARIALIGAGGISGAHLDAYRAAGFNVVAICSPTLGNAIHKRDAYFPGAEVTDDVEATLSRSDIDVVDLTPHPAARLPLIEAALNAGKHVLSQKPFVLDLRDGERLVALAEARGLVLAVNQNGRFAPHLSWMREAVRAGTIGKVHSCHATMHWDHGWTAGTPFEDLDDLILYDYAVHWFDFLASIIGPGPCKVFATTARAAGQKVRPPLLAEVLVSFEGGQSALIFDGATPFGAEHRTIVTGSEGTIISRGPDPGTQEVTLATAAGVAHPRLEGSWFKEGFIGTMGALLAAIETGNPPLNDARSNLDALALVFAAVASSRRAVPVVAGTVRSLAAAQDR